MEWYVCAREENVDSIGQLGEMMNTTLTFLDIQTFLIFLRKNKE
jgi:hypothetical protein